MKYKITITANDGRRTVIVTEEPNLIDVTYHLDHCHYKSFSIKLA